MYVEHGRFKDLTTLYLNGSWYGNHKSTSPKNTST
jgi:hypothetical protein